MHSDGVSLARGLRYRMKMEENWKCHKVDFSEWLAFEASHKIAIKHKSLSHKLLRFIQTSTESALISLSNFSCMSAIVWGKITIICSLRGKVDICDRWLLIALY